nr:transposase [Actinoallomurus iriomotensis]
MRAGNLGKPGSRRRVKAEAKPIAFRAEAAQPYDDRCLSWQYDAGTVSVWTVEGRIGPPRRSWSVTEAERTSSGISLEDLKGIRQRVRLREPQRVALHSWAFAQLADFITYKAKRAGVPVVFVDPAYTSQQCCECGHIDNKNRVSQSVFLCRNCGVVAHADRNASRNIARKGEAVWTAGRESRVPATP